GQHLVGPPVGAQQVIGEITVDPRPVGGTGNGDGVVSDGGPPSTRAVARYAQATLSGAACRAFRPVADDRRVGLRDVAWSGEQKRTPVRLRPLHRRARSARAA